MREVLFRGKRKSDEQWIYGRLSYNGLGDTMKIIENNFFKEIQIMSDTIGQYTGLTDKNGTKIFEGDIFLFGFEPCVVRYDTENARFMLYKNGISMINGFNADTMKSKEVVGNIHDNPELLKGGAE